MKNKKLARRAERVATAVLKFRCSDAEKMRIVATAEKAGFASVSAYMLWLAKRDADNLAKAIKPAELFLDTSCLPNGYIIKEGVLK